MTNIVQKAKVACMLPFYVDREVFSERKNNIEEAPETEAVTVKYDQKNEETLLTFKNRFDVRSEYLKTNATFNPSIVVPFESFLPNRYVAILFLEIEFTQPDLELNILLKFLDNFRRLKNGKLKTDKCFSVTGLDEFLSENAYRRWQDSGTILIFHRNAGAFVSDRSNKHFKEWVSKEPEILEGSKKRRIDLARSLVFQKAVLLYFKRDIINNFRDLRLENDRQGLLNRIGEEREYILQFSNRYRYSEEIGDGTMAVEIMNIWRRVMLIDALFSEVYEKLSELEQYMVTKRE